MHWTRQSPLSIYISIGKPRINLSWETTFTSDSSDSTVFRDHIECCDCSDNSYSIETYIICDSCNKYDFSVREAIPSYKEKKTVLVLVH